MDIWDVVRRWHDKQSISEISQALGYDRKTVRRYIGLAMKNGIRRDAPLPTKEQVINDNYFCRTTTINCRSM